VLAVAAIEQVAGDYNRQELQSEPVVASGNALHAVNLLGAAHDKYDYMEPEDAESMRILEDRIAADKEKLGKYKASLKAKRAESVRLSGYRAAYMRGRLEDPNSGFHDIYRQVLINAEQARGSLSDRKTFEEAHRLGSALVNLNQYLVSSSESQPLVVVRNIPITNQAANESLQIDYGYSAQSKDANVFDDGRVKVVYGNDNAIQTSQSWLSIDTLAEPPIHSLKQSGDNSHFIYDSEKVVKVNKAGAMRKGTLSSADVAPVAENAQIPLPVGNLFPPREEKPFIIHDNLHGGTDSIILPENLQGLRGQTLLLIGELAIIEGLGVLPSQIHERLGEEKGRVVRAMVKTVTRKEFDIKLAV
jgi:hypothetical protein